MSKTASKSKDLSTDLVRISDREPVVSSEVLAKGFGVTHQAVLKLIEKYRDRFQAIRSYGFEIRSRLKGKHGGKDFRYVLFNEEQTVFLATLLKNTDRVVEFKARLTSEFFRMRSALAALSAQKQNVEYLERRTAGKLTRREETDTIKHFVEYAKAQGSKHAEMYYSNISKMKNQALFFLGEKFENIREMLTLQQLSLIESADTIVTRALAEGMEQAIHYKEIFNLAKKRVEGFAAIIGKSLIPVAAAQAVTSDAGVKS